MSPSGEQERKGHELMLSPSRDLFELEQEGERFPVGLTMGTTSRSSRVT